MATRTSAVRLAIENMDASIAALRQGGEEGRKALERIGVGAQAANQNVERLDKAVGNFARNARSNIIQQAGYQIGDFAVQVQSGTNVVVAATQQLGQLAGAFGVVGAIAGGVISVLGAGIRYWQQQGEATNKAAEELKKLTEGTKSYRDMLEALAPLQVAYLENLVQGTTAAQAQAQAIAQAKVAAAGGLPGGTPTVGETGIGGAQQGEMLGPETAAQRIARLRASYTAEENLRIQFIEDRKGEEKGLTDFLINQEMARSQLLAKSGGTAGKAATGTGAFYDYLGQASSIKTYDEALAELTQKEARKTAADKAAAASAKTLADQNAKLLDQAELKTQAAQDELEALTMGEDARKRANVERKYELDLLTAAQPMNKAIAEDLKTQAAALRDVSLATIERSRAMEDAQKKIDASPGGVGGHGFYGQDMAQAKAAREQLGSQVGKDTKQFTDLQADILIQPWKDLASGVSQITTQMFDDILEKGKLSFTSLADGVGNIFKTTIGTALGSAISLPINQLAGSILEKGFGGLSQNQQIGVAGGLGGAAGYTAGTLLGPKGSYAGVGGGLGGALGAAGGTAIGAAYGQPVLGGIAGGLLGSLGGGLLGGMFGGGKEPNDQSVQKFGTAVGKAIYSDKSFGEAQRSITSGIVGQLGQLTESLRAMGGDMRGIISLQAGARTGIKVDGKSYASQEEALAGAIKAVLQQTTGLTGSQQIAVKTTQGRNVQEVMQDLAFAKEFDKITFSGTAAEAAMRDLQDQFDATAMKAKSLGLDEVALGAARERAMAQLQQAAYRQERALTAQYQTAVSGSALESSLIGINEQFLTMIDTMRDAGRPVEEIAGLEAARQRAEGEARRQDAEQRSAEAEARRQQAAAEARQARDLYGQYKSATTTDPLTLQVMSINQQFVQLTDTLKDAGYSTAQLKEVEKARNAAIREATEQMRRQQRDLYYQFAGAVSQSPFEQAANDINLQFTHLAETLKDAGYSSAQLRQVEQARIRAQGEMIEQQKKQVQDLQKDMESRILGIGSFYDNLIQPLEAVNQNSMLNPAGQIGAARTAFQRDLAGAGAQDPEAIRRLAGSAQGFQQLVQQNYGTAGVGGQYLREIQGGVGGTIAGLQQERAAALADLPQIVQKTTVDIIRENRADIDRVVEQLELLRRDLRSRGIAA